jgi:hypothetical protein
MDGFKKMHRPSRAVDMPILQQNRHEADMPTRHCDVCYWEMSGPRPAVGRGPLMTQLGHWLCTAAMVLMSGSAPIKVLS